MPARTQDSTIAPASPGAVTVVIPAYNEEGGIGRQVDAVIEVMRGSGRSFEIIVVDDGSTDETGAEAQARAVRVIRQHQNRGYGAALKLGIDKATTDLVVIIDGDGTYPADAIPRLLDKAHECDMVVGARMNSKNVPLMRRPAKEFLRRLASFLAEQEIPDLNSGLRVLRRRLVKQYEHILPSRFSFTTTITLALICSNFDVRFEPIVYQKRIGRSKIRPSDAIHFFIIVIRTVTLFNPLRIFLPLGLLPFVGGGAKLVYDLSSFNVSDGAIMGMLSALIIWSIGILADVMSKVVLGFSRS